MISQEMMKMEFECLRCNGDKGRLTVFGLRGYFSIRWKFGWDVLDIFRPNLATKWANDHVTQIHSNLTFEECFSPSKTSTTAAACSRSSTGTSSGPCARSSSRSSTGAPRTFSRFGTTHGTLPCGAAAGTAFPWNQTKIQQLWSC